MADISFASEIQSNCDLLIINSGFKSSISGEKTNLIPILF